MKTPHTTPRHQAQHHGEHSAMKIHHQHPHIPDVGRMRDEGHEPDADEMQAHHDYLRRKSQAQPIVGPEAARMHGAHTGEGHSAKHREHMPQTAVQKEGGSLPPLGKGRDRDEA